MALLSLKMTYETISVRMNRSDRNIKWGFTVRQQADGLVIDKIEPESLADKAGVKHNDNVDQINGQLTRGMDAHAANRLIDDAFNEIRLSLRRFVTSHTCLPWTLSEKDNKMVVEEMKGGFGSGFGGQKFGATSDFHGGSSTRNNQHHQSNSTIGGTTSRTNATNWSSSTGFGGGVGGATTHTNSTNYNSTPSGFGGSSYTNPTIGGAIAPTTTTHTNSTNYNSTPSGFGGSSAPPPTTYSYNNGVTSQPYGRGAGGTPLNEMTFINTTAPQNTNTMHHQYHSPSSRNRNDLSPGASVHHLQYNSPMNLYSSETAADQYYQQTGKHPEGPIPRDKIPAYLTSETKKLIEEEARGRFNRGKSPSSQSSCFKRISHAVGADY